RQQGRWSAAAARYRAGPRATGAEHRGGARRGAPGALARLTPPRPCRRPKYRGGMCMLVVARRVHPHYPLIVVANRDEVLGRPTEPLHEWTSDRVGAGGIVAGRDVTAGGTWLAVGSGGRFSAVTNVREPGPVLPAAASRGELPVDAL